MASASPSKALALPAAATVLVAAAVGGASALAARPAPGDWYSGKTSQRRLATLEISRAGRVKWIFDWRARCDRHLREGSHMLKRGYFSDPYSAVTTARIDRRGRFFDRETTIWGQPDELQVYVTARVAGRFTRGGASGTLRMRASVRRISSGRLVMRCRAPLMTWRVRRDGRVGDSRAL